MDAAARPGPLGRAEAEDALETAELVCTAADIDAAIERMAAAIGDELGASNPIVMPVLLGGVFTAVRLSARFAFPCEFDRIQVRRYGFALDGGTLEWIVEPETDVRGRTVLLVDDILDRGITLAEVSRKLRRDGAARVLSSVLVVKDVERPAGPEADFAGVHCDDRFVFGCGMDYRGHWRSLPALYAVAGT